MPLTLASACTCVPPLPVLSPPPPTPISLSLSSVCPCSQDAAGGAGASAGTGASIGMDDEEDLATGNTGGGGAGAAAGSGKADDDAAADASASKTKEAELVGMCMSLVAAICQRDLTAFAAVMGPEESRATLLTGLLKVSDEGLRKELDKGLFKACFLQFVADKSEGKVHALAARDSVVALLVAALPEVRTD
jgi:hypothetical protein